MSLVALQQVASSQTRNRTHVPCIGRWIPHHWDRLGSPIYFCLLGFAESLVWHTESLVAACELLVVAFSGQGSNPCPLLWERRVLAIGPWGKFFLFNGWLIFHCIYIFHMLFVHLSMCPWVVSIAWLLWMMLLWTRVHKATLMLLTITQRCLSVSGTSSQFHPLLLGVEKKDRVNTGH